MNRVIASLASLALLFLAGASTLHARPAPTPTPAEQLSAYLESSRLTALLAAHLESELRSAEGAARTRLARRLARVYAELLEADSSHDHTDELEQRARSLLAEVPDADSLDLRLTLARSAYSNAEQHAEKWRLRLNSRADADASRRAFVDLEHAFSDLATAAGRRVESLEKQEESTIGADRTLLSAALASARRTRSMGHFLAGWSAYYIAELDPAASADAVAKAERHFGWLLNAKSGSAPTTDRVPEHLLTYEHVARAVIGVALCESLKGTHESALRWLHLVESAPELPESVARQLTARKMILLSRAGKWADIAALVDPRGGGASASSLSPPDARLLAVLALEARQAGANTAELRPLIVLALEALAGKGELDQVLDLASRYFDRMDDIAPGGFLPAYIRGLREYDRATRDREDAKGRDDRPAASLETRRTYAGAAKFLLEALSADDSRDFDSALAGTTLLRALSRFYSAQTDADLEDAATLFTDAAARFDARSSPDAPRARLLAIRALDAAIELRSPAPAALAARRRALVDAFLRQHPTHAAAATLLYDRALSAGSNPRDAARDLLSIPDDSPLAFTAHHQAARLLYELFLAAPRDARPAAAEDFLSVAEPLLDESRRSFNTDDADATARTLTTARRVVDCLLKAPDPDPRRIRRAHDLLTNMIARGVAVPPGLLAEIEYRSVQIALLENDWPATEAARDRLRDLDPALAAAAERAIYQRSADLFRESSASNPDHLELAHTVLRLGRDVIDHLPAADADPIHPAVATLYSNVATAASTIYAATNDAAAGTTASELFATLIAAHPTDSNFLRASAMHAQQAGDAAAALAAWRGLLAGLPQGSDDWFDAKCHVIDLLIDADHDAARAALEQHRILFPDLGPEPWRTRLLDLEQRLAAQAAEKAP